MQEEEEEGSEEGLLEYGRQENTRRRERESEKWRENVVVLVKEGS